VALAISGLWLMRHGADFQWLKEQERSGALEITWVNHSYHHPYVPGRPVANNFLLMPGFDMQSEILDEERLLIANGETPSIFFRFPGLVSDAALMRPYAAIISSYSVPTAGWSLLHRCGRARFCSFTQTATSIRACGSL
jgi:hypothetical protein